MNRKLLSIVSCFLAISLLTAPKTPLQTELRSKQPTKSENLYV